MYKVWEVIDLSFKAKVNKNPYIDVEFSAKISSKNTQIEVNGFYKGEDEFVLRICMDEAAEYTYITKSNIKDLDGLMGSFVVVDNDCENCHGPIIISKENKERFSYMDGEPYNLCAFECDWLFALSYDDKIEMKKTRSIAKQISSNGFNQVVLNVYAYDVPDREPYIPVWEKDPLVNPEFDFSNRKDIFPFLGDNENPDYSMLNPVFFNHLDNVIQILNEYNIVAHLMIYVWNKEVNWPSAKSAPDNMYFDHVVNRYQAYPNIVFDISKEALLYERDTDYIVNRITRFKSLLNHSRLMTVHDYSFCSNNPELVDYISVQNWSLDLYQVMINIKEKFKDSVIFNIEHGGYEQSPYRVFTGFYTDPKSCLRRNYEIMFSGAYSTYYWQATSWNVIMMPNEAIPKPKLEYYKYMMDFFNIQNFESLKPAVEAGGGGRYMTNSEGDKYLVYINKETYAASIAKLKHRKGEFAKIKYFNTITGEYSKIEEYEITDINYFISPYDEDSILVFEF